MKEIITWNKLVLQNVLKERYKEILDKEGNVDASKIRNIEREYPDIKVAKITKFINE